MDGVTMNNISENLKKLRVNKGLKQEQVAEYLEIGRSTYTHFENGQDPDIRTLQKLADIYNVSLDELVGRDFHNQEDENIGSNKELKNSSLYRQMFLRDLLKKRTTEDTLMFMFYLLKAIDAEKIENEVEDALKLIMHFVIKNIYLKIQDINIDIIKDNHKLSLDINKKIYQLGIEMESVPKLNMNEFLSIRNKILTGTELLDPQIIKTYFRIDIENILTK
jgi:transcriptional regulator with XRE-family HTH domain